MQPLTWNANREQLGPQLFRTDFHVKWVNFLSETGWMTIDTTLIQRAGVVGMDRAPFACNLAATAAGQAAFQANNRYNVRDRKNITDPSFACLIKPLGVRDVPGEVQGDTILYKGAYEKFGDLILQAYHGRVPRLRKLIRFNAKPNADVQLEFELELPDLYDLDAAEIKADWTGADTLLSKSPILFKRGSRERGIYLSRARIWDSNPDPDLRKQAFVSVSLRLDKGRLILTKHIPAAFFDGAVFPVFTDTDFYPDPGTGATTVDGYVGKDGYIGTWANIRAQAGNHHNDTTALAHFWYALNSWTNDWDTLRRFIFTLDTSSIPDADEITEAIFKFWVTAKGNGNGWSDSEASTHLVSSSPAANNDLANADYGVLGATSFGSIGYSATTAAQYNNITLNASGIAAILKTGISKFGLKCGADFLTADPGGQDSNSYVTGYHADQAGADKDPILSVTHASSGATLVISDAHHGLIVDPIALTQVHNLSVSDAVHGLLADALALTQVHNLIVSDAVHALYVDPIALLQDYLLTISDARHGLFADPIALTQSQLLIISDATLELLSDSLDLGQAHNLVISDARHALFADSLALAQAHVLAISDALHGLFADSLTLTQAHILAISDAGMDLLADALVLEAGSEHYLVIKDARLGLAADEIVLVQLHNLAISDARHGLFADVLTLLQDQMLTIQDAVHLLHADNVIIITGLQKPVIVRFELKARSAEGAWAQRSAKFGLKKRGMKFQLN